MCESCIVELQKAREECRKISDEDTQKKIMNKPVMKQYYGSWAGKYDDLAGYVGLLNGLIDNPNSYAN